MNPTDRMVRILVVDDDEGMTSTLRDILTVKGYAVQTASSGAQAIEIVLEHRPDCILMDVRMPGMNGFEAFDEIRQHSPDSAVIFMSAFTGDLGGGENKLNLPIRVLPKPLDMDELLSTIEHTSSVTPVLLVDDDSAFCDSLGDVLANHAFEVRSAGSIDEAVRLYQQSPRQAIVLDMRLGKESGLDALDRLKRLNPKALVILISGFAELQSDLEQGLERSAYASLMKPFAPEDLVATIRQAIEERRGQLEQAR